MNMNYSSLWMLLVYFAVRVPPAVFSANGLMETERVEEYDKRYPRQWPPKDFTPNTAGWRRLHEERIQQVYEVDDYNDRYQGFIWTVFPAFLAPNFTEFGFGLARAPSELTRTLQREIRLGLDRGDTRLEAEGIGVTEGPLALMLDRPDLTDRVLRELLPVAEAWSGVKLVPHDAYGFRIYQNQSGLAMHLDKTKTHVISIIYHIDRSLDAEPWPLYIEDFHGRTYQVLMEPGDMLFYESAKCLHGRPKIFNGSYFTSLFVHYYPASGWQDYEMESHYIVPPDWNQQKEIKTQRPLQIIHSSFVEPTCPNGWCATQNAISFAGAQDGYWIDPMGTKYPLDDALFGTRNDEL